MDSFWGIFAAICLMASTLAWCRLSRPGRAPAGPAFLVWRPPPQPVSSRRVSTLRGWWRELPPGERRILGIVLATVAIVGLLSAGVVLFSAPHIWDNLAYRLARVAYYLQHKNLGYFDANYAQQVAIQKNCSILMLSRLIAFGRNENLVQLWQFLAYWTASAGLG